MKKSIFKKLGGLFLGLAMAAGVGVAVASNSKEISLIRADDTEHSPSVTFSAAGIANATIMSDYELDDHATISWDKGSAANAPTYYTSGSSVRLYCPKKGAGGIVTITIDEGYITSVSYVIGSTAGTTSAYIDGVTSSTVAFSANDSLTRTYTKANNKQSVSFQPYNSVNSTKQVYLAGVELTYFTEGGSTSEPLAVPTNLSRNNNIITWTGDASALSYTAEYDGNEITGIASTSYTIPNYTAGQHTFKVKSVGDETNYTTSAYSTTLEWDDRTATSITINGGASSLDLTTASSPTALTINTSPSGLSPLSYTSSSESVATVSNGTITVVGVGSTTITVSFAGDSTYASTSATITVNVTKVTNPLVFDYEDYSYSDGTVVSTFDKPEWSIEFNKNKNSNTPKYYSNGIRLYGGGYILITSETRSFSSITLTYGGSLTYSLDSNYTGSYSNGTWTKGSATNVQAVRINESGTSGNNQIKTVTVVFESVEEMTISPSTKEIEEFDTFTLTCSENEGVTWISSDEDVCTVEDGVIEGQSVGTATITASKQGFTTASCEVTVVPTTKPYITLSVSEIEGYTSETKEVTITSGNLTSGPTLSLPQADEGKVIWTNSGTLYTFTLVTAGNYQVTVSGSKGETNVAKTIDFSILQSQITGVTVSPSTVSLGVDESTTLTAVVSGEGIFSQTVTWSSSNTSAVTVNENTGAIHTEAIGSATITATAVNGMTGTCSVSVSATERIDSTINFGDQNQLDNETLTVENADWSNGLAAFKVAKGESTSNVGGESQKYLSSPLRVYKNQVITIGASGYNIIEVVVVSNSTYRNSFTNDTATVTGATVEHSEEDTVTTVLTPLNSSTTSITLTNSNAQFRFDSITISYYAPAQQDINLDYIVLNKDQTSIPRGGDETLQVSTFSPSDATNKEVVWSSENTDIATVEQTGKVLVSKVATVGSSVKIYCTPADTHASVVYCTVTVSAAAVKTVDMRNGLSNSAENRLQVNAGQGLSAWPDNAIKITFTDDTVLYPDWDDSNIVWYYLNSDSGSNDIEISDAEAFCFSSSMKRIRLSYNGIMASARTFINVDTTASDFAQLILMITCDGGSTAPSTSDWGDLAEMWDDADHKTISEVGKAYLLEAIAADKDEELPENPTDADYIACGLARYDYIVGKYNIHLGMDDEYPDFMLRNPVEVSGSRVLLGMINSETTNSVVIIVIISMVSVTAIGGYFFLKKRKEI